MCIEIGFVLAAFFSKWMKYVQSDFCDDLKRFAIRSDVSEVGRADGRSVGTAKSDTIWIKFHIGFYIDPSWMCLLETIRC